MFRARKRRAPAFAKFGVGSRLEEPVLDVVNPGCMAIGAGVVISSHVFLEALAPPGQVVLDIGDRTYVGHFVRITALGGVSIGDSVLISDRVYISDTGHVYADPGRPIMDQPLVPGRRVRVEDGAWLGIGCAVIGNVTIGRNAVVAANAVVRRDVEPLTAVAGDPAVTIRRYTEGRWVTVGREG